MVELTPNECATQIESDMEDNNLGPTFLESIFLNGIRSGKIKITCQLVGGNLILHLV
jgi:hypothetical protein